MVPCVEVTAVMLNINRGHNRELMERCHILWEYSEFVGRVRENRIKYGTLEDAADHAVESCIRDGILTEFLKAHRAEVMEVVLTEYDEEGYIAYEKGLSREEGLEEGIQKGISEGEVRKLIQQVCKKLSKDKAVGQIAEELEEDVETVARICEAAGHFSPDYDCGRIYKWMAEQQGIAP